MEIKTDHQTVDIITQERITKKRKPIIKTFYEKPNYTIKDFTSELKICEWKSTYKKESAEEMYSQFNSILSSIIQKHAPLVKKFVRNDKAKIFFLNEKSIRDLFTNSEVTKKKWRVINDTRNTTVSNNNIFSLKKSFGEILFDNKQIVNLLNYRFSKLGDYFGKARPYEKSTQTNNGKSFSFRFVTLKEVLHHLKTLNTSKPLAPTEISAWALKDGKDV